MSEEAQSEEALDNLSHEDRRFPPPDALAGHGQRHRADLLRTPRPTWTGSGPTQAERISWGQEPTEVVDWSNPPFAKWYADGTLNAAYNCCDRHVEAGNGDRVAFHFEGEPGDTRVITYAQLTDEVKRAANALVELGVSRAIGSRSICR